MAGYMFALEKYTGMKSRYACPQCGHRHQFARYVNTETGEYVDDNVGCCNRLDKCGYHRKPKDFFADNPGANVSSGKPSVSPKATAPLSSTTFDVIPFDLVKKSLAFSPKSNFHSFLSSQFGKDVSEQKSNQFLFGTSKTEKDATIFWQVDINNVAHSGKVILYDPNRGKRGKKIDWVHSKISRKTGKPFTLKQCFFGEHQLATNPGQTVAIVESEKTAIIASIMLPEYLWLATCGVNGCKWRDKNVASVLLGRKVVLFPDLGMFDRWSNYASELQKQLSFDISISDLVERSTTPVE